MRNTGIKHIVLEEITVLAKKYDITKIILFGSRARGGFHKTSDIDLAVTGGDIIRFTLDINENTSTLLKYDIVNLNAPVNGNLRTEIDKEGRVIYEKN